jgi:hypothetical protein
MQRIGDKICPRGISIKMYMANKFDRMHTQVRVIVAVLPKVVAGAVTIPRFDPFQLANSGANGNNMINPPDSDRGIKFLYDRTYILDNMGWVSAPGGGYAKEPTKYIKLWIKHKGSNVITYDQGTFDISERPLAVYVIPYEQYSTLNTDNVTSMAGYMRMYYKDV